MARQGNKDATLRIIFAIVTFVVFTINEKLRESGEHSKNSSESIIYYFIQQVYESRFPPEDENKMAKSKNKRVWIAAILLLGSFITILNQTLMITAIPPIMAEMNISANIAQWLTTTFMLVMGIMIPVSAFLVKRYTTRQLFFTAMGVFTLGTILCGLAPNYSFLIAGRMIQSAGAGIMLPLMQNVFLLIFPVSKRGTAMGYIGLVISFAPAIGPVLSGWVTANYSWRLLFVIALPLALMIMYAGHRILENVTEQTNPKVDILSIMLSSFGFGGLLFAFTNAGNVSWTSTGTLVSFFIGGTCLLLFLQRQLQLQEPMLEFRIFKYPIFTIATIIGMVSFLGLIGSETMIPLYMQNMREFSAYESGLVLLPGALIVAFMSPINGRIFDKFGAKQLVITGLVIMTAASFAFSFLDDTTTIGYLTFLYGVRMLGMSMVMMPVTTAGLNQLPRALLPHGTALSNTFRQMAASIGTAVLVTVMTSTAQSARARDLPLADIQGVNAAFLIISCLSLAGIALAFFIKPTYSEKAETMDKDA